jgi:cytochrome subunit of sulfide dehydrogenase
MTPGFNRLFATAIVAGTLGAAAPALAGPSGEAMAASCAACHGPNGSSFGPMTPTIASLSTDYFVMSMKDYRDGKRPATVMDRIAKGYSDADIAEMAAYFQKQTFVRHPQATDAEKVKSGKALAKKYCGSCHEDEGRIAEGVGMLAGQWLPYMQYSMEDFLSGKRQTERRQKAKFDELVRDKGEGAFVDILHYYASVK